MSCPNCGAEALSGCTCAWASSDTIVAEIGTTPEQVRLLPRVDSVPGNLVQCGTSGLGATLARKYTNPPRLKLRRSASKSVPIFDGTPTSAPAIDWDTTVYDTHNMHTGTQTYAIVPVGYTGLWKVGFCLNWQGSADGFRTATMYLNRRMNSLYELTFQRDDGRATGNFMNAEAECYLEERDMVEVYCASSAAAVAILVNGLASPAMWMHFIGEVEA